MGEEKKNKVCKADTLFTLFLPPPYLVNFNFGRTPAFVKLAFCYGFSGLLSHFGLGYNC